MARKIQVEIVGDASKLERAFRKAEASSSSFGGKMGGALGGMAKKAAVLTGAMGGLAVVMGVKSVNAASDLGEQMNKTSVVFGDSARQIQKWGQQTAASIGISNRAALEFAGTFGNMLVPMGFARSEAAKMSRRLVDLAADMASFNNANPEEVLEALRAGLSGETEPLRRFGIFLNADRIAAEALAKGIAKTTKDVTKIKVATIKLDRAQAEHLKTVKKYGVNSKEAQESLVGVEVAQNSLTKALAGSNPKLTAQQKAMATYSIILGDTKDAQGDFQRTSESLPNAMRAIRASVEDLQAAFGEGLLPVVQGAAAALQKNLANPKFRERVRELGRVIGEKLLKAFRDISDWFIRHWGDIKNGMSTARDIAAKLAEAAKKVHEWFNRIASVTPGGSATLLGVIVSGLLATKLATALANARLLNKQFLLMAGRLAPLIAGIIAIQEFRDPKTERPPGTKDPGLKQYIPGWGWAWGGYEPEPPKPKGRPRGTAPNKNTDRRAVGGSVRPGQSYLVGERGPEVLTMGGQRGFVAPNAGGITIGSVHLHGVQDAPELLRQLERIALSSSAGRRGRFGGGKLALG